MIVADIRIVPVGIGTSISQEVRAIYKMLDKKGVKYIPGPMSTSLEVQSLDNLFDLIKTANKLLEDRGMQRILITINIDNRLDKEISIETKLRYSKLD
jgi:uncharacterized protein (TIGR00106 family)